MTEDRINIADEVAALSSALKLDQTYVHRFNITPGSVTVELYSGKEGRCQGPKYIDLDTGEPVMETLEFKVIT